MIAELWHQLADPVEHAATRRVLADALLAADDPQGTYIALSTAPDALLDDDVAFDPRTWDALLQAHARTWLGAYAKVTQRAQFANGFPTRIELNAYHVDDGELAALLADPRFATVEDLVTGFAKAPLYAAILARSKHASLRSIEIKGADTLAALEITSAPIAHVAAVTWHDRGMLDEVLATRILPACERISTVTSIAVHADQRDVLLASRIFPRLTRVTLGPEIGSVAMWPAMHPHQELVITTPRLPGAGRARPAEIRLARATDGVHAKINGQLSQAELLDRIQILPRDTAHLEVHGYLGYVVPIMDVCKRRGIIISHRAEYAPRYGFVVVGNAVTP